MLGTQNKMRGKGMDVALPTLRARQIHGVDLSLHPRVFGHGLRKAQPHGRFGESTDLTITHLPQPRSRLAPQGS